MEPTYKVVYSGQLHAGAQLEETAEKLMAASGLSKEKAAALLSSGKAVVLKKNLSRETAEKYVRSLDRIGMQTRLVPSQPPPADKTASPPQPESEQKETARQEPVAIEAAAETNPYAIPEADLTSTPEGGGTFRADPEKVPAGHGWLWIKDAFELFQAEPWKWVGMSLVMFLILFVIGLIPLVGNFIQGVPAILLGAGMMIGAHSLKENDGLEFSHLFAGFSQNRNQLLLTGAYYILAMLIITIIVLVPIGAGVLKTVLLGNHDPDAIGQAIMQHLPLFLLSGLIGLILYLILLMAFYFTPALVALAGSGSISAMKLSLRATTKNWLPFLVYGLAFLVAGIGVMIVFSVVSGISAFLFGNSGAFFITMIMSFLFMIALGVPLMIIASLSVYTCFRDIFYQNT